MPPLSYVPVLIQCISRNFRIFDLHMGVEVLVNLLSFETNICCSLYPLS